MHCRYYGICTSFTAPLPLFLGRRRRPYIVFRNRFLYGFMFVYIYRMAGNFGGLLKICHLAEFTLAVEPGLAIMIFITKWLLKRAGIIIGP